MAFCHKNKCGLHFWGSGGSTGIIKTESDGKTCATLSPRLSVSGGSSLLLLLQFVESGQSFPLPQTTDTGLGSGDS